MSWVNRHVVAFGVVLFAVAAMGGVFAFASPAYHQSSSEQAVSMKGQHQYTVAQVEHAFALQGLLINSVMRHGGAQKGTTILDQRHGKLAPDWTVSLFGPNATVYFSENMQGYVARFGNLMVFYGGKNAALLVRVKAAAADLQH